MQGARLEIVMLAYPGCCVASANVNIFAFLCYVLNQIEDAVAYVFYQDNALLRSGKPAERTSAPLVRPLAVFLDLKLILFS